MDIEIEEDGFYPAHTRYTRELWMHMIEHCHHQQMRDAFDMDPTNVCWDENSWRSRRESGPWKASSFSTKCATVHGIQTRRITHSFTENSTRSCTYSCTIARMILREMMFAISFAERAFWCTKMNAGKPRSTRAWK